MTFTLVASAAPSARWCLTTTASVEAANWPDLDKTNNAASDADGVTPMLEVGSAKGHLGTRELRFRVGLSRPTCRAVGVDYATADGTATAGLDYDTASGTIDLPAGSRSGWVRVSVHGDAVDEVDETVLVKLVERQRSDTWNSAGYRSHRERRPGALRIVTASEGNCS